MSALTEENVLLQKAGIRKELAGRRDSLSMEQRSRWSETVCARAKELLERKAAASFMAYVSFRSELDLSGLIEWGWQTGRTVIVPRCHAANRSMTLYRLRSWEELKPGAYGIMEPNPDIAQPLEADYVPEAVFVPGLAYDRRGGRLGYGGGYYDRFAESLQNAERTVLWLGPAFEAQLVERVPSEGHDLKVQAVITESNVYDSADQAGKE
ncbi:5-formyltetrahydrofolate cyclo-ligase [Paenibacillus sp. N4]|uniref:5-formyltetrahydrofolate cyclo-ligase n=1 Tax=Paenibacillus vietnamensis TaxID=2590547 RepID=UPI001CD0E20D|nr:5-formyltetrahydrofolate cyclo-ligase [Paenibacillus vietnamensis]MCA0756700.1 5-formyltetrahydrofolate cyclo-ligase [Paenibacillus vietnamensis]